MTIIERIFELKDEHNLTSKDVERGAGLANSSLSQWKKGRGKPSLENIIKVADFFHVTTDYLLCLSDDRNNRQNQFFEDSLTEEEMLLLRAYHTASTYDRLRIIQICMNALDSAEKGDSKKIS